MPPGGGNTCRLVAGEHGLLIWGQELGTEAPSSAWRVEGGQRGPNHGGPRESSGCGPGAAPRESWVQRLWASGTGGREAQEEDGHVWGRAAAGQDNRRLPDFEMGGRSGLGQRRGRRREQLSLEQRSERSWGSWGQVRAVPGQEEVMEMSSWGVRGWGWGEMG